MTEHEEIIIDDTPRIKTLTVDEAVKATGIGRSGIDKMIKDENSNFPFFKIGTKHYIPAVALELWLINTSQRKEQF